jgi:hypothetical protein
MAQLWLVSCFLTKVNVMLDTSEKRLLEMSNSLYHNSQELKRVQCQGGELNLRQFKAGKKMDGQHLQEHLVNTGKVMAGGAGVGSTTYAAIANMDIAHATALASLAAAVMTALYFAVSAGYAVWKWRKEANGSAP